MSSKTYQDKVNRLDREIADLEKKRAQVTKQIADKNTRAISLNSSLKSASTSTYASKVKQISVLNGEVAKLQVKQADYEKQIGRKRDERNHANIQLQQEIAKENKKLLDDQKRAQKRITDDYNKEIRKLKKSVENSVHIKTVSTNIYNEVNDEETQYDVFISHASEDKESFVNEFVDELEKRGISVWYDKQEIKWGDSLRSKIDAGLRNSRFGIVVISTHYISKGWTQYELEGLFNIEMTNGKTILPIWHDITKKQVQDYSPSLAGRLAMTTANMTPSEIAEELYKILKES